MPTKKKRFNARFPPARIKKIMQTDEEVGKVAAAVPVIISKALEMFMQSLVENACDYAQSRNAKTMTCGHLKKCITSQQQFDFLKDLVEHIPDLPTNEEDTEGEAKPKRRRAQPQDQEKRKEKKERKKTKAVVSDESEEELESDEEESGSSEGLATNPSGSATNMPQSSTVSTVTGPATTSVEQPDFRLGSAAPPFVPQFSQFPSVLSTTQEEEDDDYDA